MKRILAGKTGKELYEIFKTKLDLHEVPGSFQSIKWQLAMEAWSELLATGRVCADGAVIEDPRELN